MVGERLDAPQEDDETEEEELLEARPTKEGYTATVRGTRRSSTYNHHQFLSFIRWKMLHEDMDLPASQNCLHLDELFLNAEKFPNKYCLQVFWRIVSFKIDSNRRENMQKRIWYTYNYGWRKKWLLIIICWSFKNVYSFDLIKIIENISQNIKILVNS